MNICDYLDWRGDLSFKTVPFCEIDALIFAWLAYYEYEKLYEREAFDCNATVQEVGQKHEQVFGKVKKINLKLSIIPCVSATYLLSLAQKTERYGNVRISRFQTKYDPLNNIQFAAVTFVTDEFTTVVFRGTDDSVAGWKEDFDLSYAESVPAQDLALSYLKEEVEKWQERPVYVCGHSKGGNLSMYAALHLPKETLDRLSNVYNFDGPGFNRPIKSFDNYAVLKERIITILPESSIVGLLLHHENDYLIITSEMVSIFQHNALMWQVLGKNFIYTDEFRESSIIIKNTLTTWLEGMTDEEKAEMVNTLFGLVQEAGIHSLDDLNDEGLLKIIKTIRNAAMLTFDQKKKMLQVLYELAKAGTISVTNSLLDSEFATEAVESARIVKNNISEFFMDGSERLKKAIATGPKNLLSGIFGKNKEG